LRARTRSGALLSEQQLEIAARAAAGMSNKDIEHELHLASRTVENKLSHIYQLLGVRGRKDLLEVLRPADE
jgi:DNA-binding NarL/FixJ family response regulator